VSAKGKTALSGSLGESFFFHAIVRTKDSQPPGARVLGVRTLALDAQGPFTSRWRASALNGQERGHEVSLVVVRNEAGGPARERFARVAQDLLAAGDGLNGVLRVRAVAPSGEAYLADYWSAGTIKDLSALRWPLRRRLELVSRIAQSLEMLHARGLVHGSLTPENVLLDDDLHPVLSDVGLAMPAATTDMSSYAEFAAPEVMAGEAPNASSDIFSVGRVLQMVALGDVTPEVAEVIRSCSGPPESRYASAADLQRALTAIAEKLPQEEVSPEALLESVGAAFRPAATPEAGRPQLAPVARERTAVPAPDAARDAVVPALVTGADLRSVVARRAPLVGLTGLLAVGVALGGACLLGGSNSSLRDVFGVLLVLGSAAAVWFLPCTTRAPAAVRIALAGLCAALVGVINPLAYVYGAAAQHRLRGGEGERRAAIDEIVRLGRDFRGVSLAGINLSGLDLTGADLRGVDLARADLSHTRLWGAEIAGASFEGARLEGADMDRTSLALARIDGATCDARTLLPAGWRCAGSQVTR
jgi:uncharacterized protein YjbI with pentapeptide repeats